MNEKQVENARRLTEPMFWSGVGMITLGTIGTLVGTGLMIFSFSNDQATEERRDELNGDEE